MGLSGQARGCQTALRCLPRPSISLFGLPRALRLPFGAALSPPYAFRCPARALCLPLGTQHGPVRALGCHPEPSLRSHPGLALSNKSSTAALLCRIASLFDCCSSCSNAVKVVVAASGVLLAYRPPLSGGGWHLVPVQGLSLMAGLRLLLPLCSPD